MEIRQPTNDNKKVIQANRLNPERWLVVWEDHEVLEIVNKRTRQRRVIAKAINNDLEE